MIGVFLDLDGTLLNSKWEISNEDLSFLKSIKDKVNIYLITGSSYNGALTYYEQLELNTWFVTSQGQEISKPNEGIFNVNSIDNRKVKHFIECKHDEYFLEASNGIFKTDGFDLDIRTNKKQLDSIDELKNVTSIITNNKPPHDIDLKYYEWDVDENTKWYVIHNKESDKSVSVDEIIELDKLSKTYYFGDGKNDIKAMKKVDISVAMNNSYDIVKESAMYITKYTNNDSGVSRSLKKLFEKEEKWTIK